MMATAARQCEVGVSRMRGGDGLALLCDALASARAATACFDALAAYGEDVGFHTLLCRQGGGAGPVRSLHNLGVKAATLVQADGALAWPFEMRALAGNLPVRWSTEDWRDERDANAAGERLKALGLEAGVSLAIRDARAGVTLITGFCARDELALLDRLQLDLWLVAASRFQDRIGQLPTLKGARLELSRRERQMLRLSADGLTAAAAAEMLGLTEATVKFHLASARRKLGVKNTAQAISRLQGLDPGNWPE